MELESLQKRSLREILKLAEDKSNSEISKYFNGTAPSEPKFSSRYQTTLEAELLDLRNAVRKCEGLIAQERGQLLRKTENSQGSDLVKSRIHAIDKSLSQIPAPMSSFSSLGRILAIDKLQTVNADTSHAIKVLEESEKRNSHLLDREKVLNKELQTLNVLLKVRANEISASKVSSSQVEPASIISELASQRDNEEKKHTEKLDALRKILENVAAPIIHETNQQIPEYSNMTLDDIRLELNNLILNLLNEMFDTTVSGGYVQVNDFSSPIIKFLLNGNLITTKSNDATFIRLREFGM